MKTLQPNSRHCFVCGIKNPFGLQLRFYDTGPGEVTAEFTAPAHYQGYPGVVHGGIVTAMLDELAGRAHMTGDEPRFMYTARLEVRFRRNVPIEQPLRLVGRAEPSKRRMARASSAIYDQDGNLLAEADALLINLPEDAMNGLNAEELGWQVYSEEELHPDGQSLTDRSDRRCDSPLDHGISPDVGVEG